MNSTFDTGRFGKYFSYDLTRSWQNAGLTVLINACMPIFTFVFVEMFSLLFTHHFTELPTYPKVIAYFVSFVIVFLAFPVRQYGSLTSREAGSNWILLPASKLEKFLSMVLITCVILPLVWFAVIAASDGLLSLLFHNLYCETGLSAAIWGLRNTYDAIEVEGMRLFIRPIPAVWLSWCSDILFFTLAAIFFRKYKIVYGFLVMMGLSMAFTMVCGVAINVGLFDGWFKEVITPENVMRIINVGIAIWYVVLFGLLLGGIWLRIKTIKH